ncbi:MAG: hypothetical protein JXR37_10410 [Kiritimatiellae bacterium]|nr:hypothetical protein [Kiritimatiellia bacterium]
MSQPSQLAVMADVLGALITASGLVCLLAPTRVREWARRFPRSLLAGRILTAGVVIWVALVLVRAPFGRFENLKPLLYVAAPLFYFLVVRYMDELLAPRALGGLLLLVANPVLKAAFLHESNIRLVMTVLAYLLVIAGMALVLGPYRFRLVAERFLTSDARCRALGAMRLVLGGLLLGLGLLVY